MTSPVMTPNQRGFVTVASMVLGVFATRRWLRNHAIGQVVIGPVTVTPTVLDDEDIRQGVLSAHQREGMTLLAVDLDTMSPTHHPTAKEDARVVQIIQELLQANRTGDGQFLETMLVEARRLPAS